MDAKAEHAGELHGLLLSTLPDVDSSQPSLKNGYKLACSLRGAAGRVHSRSGRANFKSTQPASDRAHSSHGSCQLKPHIGREQRAFPTAGVRCSLTRRMQT